MHEASSAVFPVRAIAIARDREPGRSPDTFSAERREPTDYPDFVDLTRLRGQMPIVAFILLAVVCLALLGFACACLSNQPALALDRALQGPGMPGLVEVWPLLLLGMLAPVLLLFGVEVPARGRASPALLQRFLF